MNLMRFLKVNNIKINNIVAKSLRYTLYLLLIIWCLVFSNLINFDKSAISLCLASCGILLLIPTIFINCLNIEKNYIMYMVIICTSLVSAVLCSFLSYYASAIVLFPLLIASLYYNRVLVLFTTLINTALMLGSSILNMYIGLIPNDPLAQSFEAALFYNFIPKELVIIFMSFIAYFIVDRNNEMMADIFIYSQQLKISQEEIILSFSNICESKSKSTGEHVRRVSKYMRVLCEASGFDEDYTDMVCTASMMHDIGKLMIPEEILNKPGKLTDEEYAIVKNHVLYGEALLHNATGEIMEIARTIALQHHERWDGKGYLGMKGEEIAYVSWLMALADVFDALSASRCYKEGWTLAQTYNEIALGSGTQFDPQVVELFKDNYDKFVEIFKSIPDVLPEEEGTEHWEIQSGVKIHTDGKEV
ncbi:MAG: HD-GYP domain-containing protein [Clostridium sp.]|nr:HD-GYP domain-containing protein [Clostridium sp.]